MLWGTITSFVLLQNSKKYLYQKINIQFDHFSWNILIKLQNGYTATSHWYEQPQLYEGNSCRKRSAKQKELNITNLNTRNFLSYS